MYIRFSARQGFTKIPGRDAEFDIILMQKYLQWRGNKNNIRSLNGIKSKLKHCGVCHGFVLPTAKGDNESVLRLQLQLVTSDIRKKKKRQCKKQGKTDEPKRSLALGKVSISLLFSAMGVHDEKSFKALSSPSRHWLAMSVCMHAGAMRCFLLCLLRDGSSLRWSDIDQAFRMSEDWHKMKKGGAYTIPFFKHPPYKALQYEFLTSEGKRRGTFTAATVLEWHNQTRDRNEKMFAPMGEKMPSAHQFQIWLRGAFTRLLIGQPQEVNALVSAITPHSFRAGLAGDMWREGVITRVIMKFGRWNDPRAMTQYARDALAQRIQQLRYQPIDDEEALHLDVINGKQLVHKKKTTFESRDPTLRSKEFEQARAKAAKSKTNSKKKRKREQKKQRQQGKQRNSSNGNNSSRSRKRAKQVQPASHHPTPGHHTRN